MVQMNVTTIAHLDVDILKRVLTVTFHVHAVLMVGRDHTVKKVMLVYLSSYNKLLKHKMKVVCA